MGSFAMDCSYILVDMVSTLHKLTILVVLLQPNDHDDELPHDMV